MLGGVNADCIGDCIGVGTVLTPVIAVTAEVEVLVVVVSVDPELPDVVVLVLVVVVVLAVIAEAYPGHIVLLVGFVAQLANVVLYAEQ